MIINAILGILILATLCTVFKLYKQEKTLKTLCGTVDIISSIGRILASVDKQLMKDIVPNLEAHNQRIQSLESYKDQDQKEEIKLNARVDANYAELKAELEKLTTIVKPSTESSHEAELTRVFNEYYEGSVKLIEGVYTILTNNKNGKEIEIPLSEDHEKAFQNMVFVINGSNL